jgi:mannose-6-phosphate isomerase-like protein (cupin superfamily)
VHVTRVLRDLAIAFLLFAPGVFAAEGKVDPTFIRRYLPEAPERPSALTSSNCRYKSLFGEGDKYASLPKSVTRYGELILDPNSNSALARFPKEEQIYFVLDGSGNLVYSGGKYPIRKGDFMYLPPGVEHGLTSGTEKLQVIWMGFRIPATGQAGIPGKPSIANMDEVKKQVVGGHPPSTLYQLMIGGVDSKRDRIAAGLTVTSLFVMEFTPGGTNTPHHHEYEEEIYLLLDGSGDMVAGGGMDGIEGRFPSKPGDAFFYRQNATVGFYSDGSPGAPKAHILAVRCDLSERPTTR